MSTANGDVAIQAPSEPREDESKKIRKDYRRILEDLDEKARQEEEEDGGNRPDGEDEEDEEEESGGVFSETAKQVTKLFENVRDPSEALLDARIIHGLSSSCRRRAERLSTNARQFRPGEFGDRLVKELGGISRAERRSKRGSAHVRTDQWMKLGTALRCLFARPPALQYIYGAIDPRAVTVERKTRQRRVRTREADLIVTKSTRLTEAEVGPGAHETEALVTSTFKQLVRAFKENGRRPFCYFRFVINPHSFGATIENVFHVSFLVKEGKVRISIDEDVGLPVIEPLSKSSQRESVSRASGDEDTARKKQVVINLCMSDWKKMREALAIARPAIVHEKNPSYSEDGGKRPRTGE